MKEVEGLAKLAMVSALGLFELVQVLLEVSFLAQAVP